jgi:ATP-binding cassette subfamily B protein
MLVSGLAELVSLSSVLPFLALLSNPELVWQQTWAKGVAFRLGFVEVSDLVLPITLIFGLAAIFAAFIRLTNLWLNGRLAAAVGSDLSCESYLRTLYQPYEVHVERNSAAIIAGSTTQIARTVGALTDLLQLITAVVVATGLMIGLLVINWRIALGAALLFGSIYGLIGLTVRKELNRNSNLIADAAKQQIKALQEGLGAIRDVIIDSSQELYADIYRKADRPQRELQARNQFLSLFPRYTLEALGLVAIASVGGASVLWSGSNRTLIPLLGAFALGAQRLLPALQQIYNGWTGLKANSADLAAVLSMINQPIQTRVASTDVFQFRHQLSLVGVHYHYGKSKSDVLKGINLEVFKGDRVGIVGVTGSGKSTTIDILMGLLPPTHGSVLIDGLDLHDPLHPERLQAWRGLVCHVPQSIFLSDASIAENIAFGLPPDRIDFERVRHAAEQAQIAQFIESIPERYSTFVGERGVRLSGGQRQRIGIARALYKDSQILVFDEATSALDQETERRVIDSIEINSPGLTLIMVAHRLATLANCDHIIRLKEGCVDSILSPQQLLQQEANY